MENGITDATEMESLKADCEQENQDLMEVMREEEIRAEEQNRLDRGFSTFLP